MDDKKYQCIECAFFDRCQEDIIIFADDTACMDFKLADYLIKDGPANREHKQK